MPKLATDRNQSTITSPAPSSPTFRPTTTRRRSRTARLIAGLALAGAATAAALVFATSSPESPAVLDLTVTHADAGDCDVPVALATAEGVSHAELCHPSPAPPVPDLRMR